MSAQNKQPREYRRIAERNWAFWRIVLSDNGITYGDAQSMDWEEIYEANAAIDIWQSKTTGGRRRKQ
ncbi:hypothetical protein [Paenibacillus periandrae]|uniref:hypothetical protein n=1 Tax=Paenibacillus periandrae TaxID=1761741 RepID=UPI001F08BF04|nr:hypothetical protein [Paenibacillus periandrae]